MTVVLLETDSTTQTLVQGNNPLFRGRAVAAYGNNTVLGAPSSLHGCASFGACDGVNGEVAALGLETSVFGGFDNSGAGSIGPGTTEFYGVIESWSSVFTNTVELTEFFCGDLQMTNIFTPDSDKLGVLVLGGSTLQTKIGYLQVSGTGDYVEAGVGFTPQLILFFSRGVGSFGEPVQGFGTRSILMFGATDGVNQWCHSAAASNLVASTFPGNRQSQFTNAACIQTVKNVCEATIVSMDADGFTVNFSAQDDPIQIMYFAIADPGGDFAVGDGVEGDTSITPGFEAEAVFFGSAGTTNTSPANGASFSTGCATPDFARAGWGAAGDPEKSYWADAAIAISGVTPTGSPSNDAEADASAWNATTVDLNWTTGGGGGRLFGWAALRTSEGVGWSGCGFRGQIYRILKI